MKTDSLAIYLLVLGIVTCLLAGGHAIPAERTPLDTSRILKEREQQVASLLAECRDLAVAIGVGKVMVYEDADKAKRLCACVDALGTMRAKEAAPFLAGIIKFRAPGLAIEGPPRFEDAPAAVALVQIGMPAFGSLRSLLTSEDRGTWQLALEALHRILGHRLAILYFGDEESVKDMPEDVRAKCRKYLELLKPVGDVGARGTVRRSEAPKKVEKGNDEARTGLRDEAK